MNRRVLILSVLAVVCLATLWSVATQRQQLLALRAEQQRLLAQTDGALQASGATAATTSHNESLDTPADTAGVPPELLRLRSEVARLTQRRRELEGVQRENESLRAGLAIGQTNNATAMKLPPGYIRRTQARQVGYATPEDTMQTFLWALQSRNFTNVLQVLTPTMAQQLAPIIQGADAADFFSGVDAFIGLNIAGRKDMPDGSVQLTIELMPGAPPQAIRLERVNGQWKMASSL